MKTFFLILIIASATNSRTPPGWVYHFSYPFFIPMADKIISRMEDRIKDISSRLQNVKNTPYDLQFNDTLIDFLSFTTEVDPVKEFLSTEATMNDYREFIDNALNEAEGYHPKTHIDHTDMERIDIFEVERRLNATHKIIATDILKKFKRDVNVLMQNNIMHNSRVNCIAYRKLKDTLDSVFCHLFITDLKAVRLSIDFYTKYGAAHRPHEYQEVFYSMASHLKRVQVYMEQAHKLILDTPKFFSRCHPVLLQGKNKLLHKYQIVYANDLLSFGNAGTYRVLRDRVRINN